MNRRIQHGEGMSPLDHHETRLEGPARSGLSRSGGSVFRYGVVFPRISFDQLVSSKGEVSYLLEIPVTASTAVPGPVGYGRHVSENTADALPGRIIQAEPPTQLLAGFYLRYVECEGLTLSSSKRPLARSSPMPSRCRMALPHMPNSVPWPPFSPQVVLPCQSPLPGSGLPRSFQRQSRP